MFLTIAIAAVSLGAFFDGWSTSRAIRKGAHEADPIAAWIFGTAIPTAKAVYLRGGLVIAAESALALTLGHFWPHVGIGLAIALFAQAVVHFYEFIRAFRMY
jgi:hypothetical protein